MTNDEALFNFDKLPDAAFVRLPVIAALYSVSEPTVWRWVKQGLIARPLKLGPNTTAWNVGDVRALRKRLEDEAAAEEAVLMSEYKLPEASRGN